MKGGEPEAKPARARRRPRLRGGIGHDGEMHRTLHGWTMERSVAAVFGSVYLALAIAGITANIAALNAAHNVVHLVAAVMWLTGAAVGAAPPAHLGAGIWLIGAGVLGLAGAIELTASSGLTDVVEDVLHLLNGVGALALGAWTLRGAQASPLRPG